MTIPPVPDRRRRLATWIRGESGVALVTVVALTCAGLALRLLYLRAPIRGDEAFTYFFFAKRSWLGVMSAYDAPNNHILSTLSIKAMTGLFGDDVTVMRAPALLAGVLCIPLTYAVGRAYYGPIAGLVGAAVVATSPRLTLFSALARGYSFVVLATLLLMLVAAMIRQRPSRARWGWFVVVAVLGVYTIPVMLYPLGGIVLWLALTAAVGDTPSPSRLAVGLAWAAGGIAIGVMVLYTPVILACGIGCLVANRYVRPMPWAIFGHDAPLHLWPTATTSVEGLAPALVWLLAAAALAAVIAQRRVGRSRLHIGVVMVAWAVVLLVATHRVPPSRTWLYLIPVAAMSAGAGVQLVMQSIPAGQSAMLPVAAAMSVALAGCAGASAVAHDFVLADGEGASLPDAAAIAADLAPRLGARDVVLSAGEGYATLLYYFRAHQIGIRHLRPDLGLSGGTVYTVVVTGSLEPTPADVYANLHVDTSAMTPPALYRQYVGATVFISGSRAGSRP